MRSDPSQVGDGFHAAFQLLKQERRSFRQQHPALATASDSVALDTQLEQHQRQILRESAQRNELGLYRNACLLLGCIAITRDDYDAALDYILDVAFLDIAGATNSLPGRRSFDARLSLVIPFVSGILRDLCSTLELQPEEMESIFRARGDRFSSFGTPSISQESAWRKMLTAL